MPGILLGRVNTKGLPVACSTASLGKRLVMLTQHAPRVLKQPEQLAFSFQYRTESVTVLLQLHARMMHCLAGPPDHSSS